MPKYFSLKFVLADETTWLIGSSLVVWAGHRARAQQAVFPKLTSPTTHWHGSRGMNWCQLMDTVRHLLRLKGPPGRLILHLGGNDLADTPLRQMVDNIKIDLQALKVLMPDTHIIWSDITARREYRHAVSSPKVEKARKTLNHKVHVLICQLGGSFVKHPAIKWDARDLYRPDGVHLSNMGNDILLEDWQSTMYVTPSR